MFFQYRIKGKTGKIFTSRSTTLNKRDHSLLLWIMSGCWLGATSDEFDQISFVVLSNKSHSKLIHWKLRLDRHWYKTWIFFPINSTEWTCIIKVWEQVIEVFQCKINLLYFFFVIKFINFIDMYMWNYGF